MRTRSFHIILMLFGLASGCVSDSVSTDPSATITPNPIEEFDTGDITAAEISFTEEEVNIIVAEIKSGDYSTLESFTDAEREAFIDAMQAYGIILWDLVDEEEQSGAVPPPSGLSACSGYWGIYAYAEYVERWDTSGGWLSYSTGPNCVMWAPGSDCGTDYDDYMLSFYFGNHSESASTLRSMLRWNSSSAIVSLLLGTVEGRLYEQTRGGSRDNYNFYACVDDFFGGYLETISLQKYN